MRWYHWIWLPIVAVAVAVSYALGARKGELADELALEMDVIEKRAEAKRIVALHGADDARAAVESEYKNTIQRLDEDQRNEADRLRSDPAALAEFLIRAAYGARTPAHRHGEG